MTHFLTHTVIATTLLALFFGGTVLMPIAMMAMEHHEHVPSSKCPFMTSEETLCTMSAFEHLSLWQLMMTAILSPLLIMVVVAGAFAFFWLQQSFHGPPNIAFDGIKNIEDDSGSFFAQFLLHSVINPRAP